MTTSLLFPNTNIAGTAVGPFPGGARQGHFLLAKPHPFSLLSSSSSPPPPLPAPGRSAHVARARKGGVSSSSRSRRQNNSEKKGGRGGTIVKEAAEEEKDAEKAPVNSGAGGAVEGFEYSTTPMPALPGEGKDLWEGPQWDGLGFFVQYQWAFGIGFALIACGIAVATYNDGATDFRQTSVYKESIQSQELLEEPDASNTDVFEGNPTEVAPSLE